MNAQIPDRLHLELPFPQATKSLAIKHKFTCFLTVFAEVKY